MNETLSEVIRIRVTPSHAARLGEAAALSGLSLSNYIRRRLSADDTLQEELTLHIGIHAMIDGQRRQRSIALQALSHHLCFELRAVSAPCGARGKSTLVRPYLYQSLTTGKKSPTIIT